MATELFEWIDALWNKKKLEGRPPTMTLLHAFLASDKDYAIYARHYQRDLSGFDILFHAWQGLLPKAPKAPRLSYVKAKRRPGLDDPKLRDKPEVKLTKKMMAVLGERRSVVEEMQQVVEQTGRLEELYLYYGIEPPRDVGRGA